MKAAGILLIILIVVGLFLLGWYIFYKSKCCSDSESIKQDPNVVLQPDTTFVTENDEFKKRYKVFYERMIVFINTRSIEDRKLVNDAITSLSSLVCSAENTLPNTLYMRKITILSDIFDLLETSDINCNEIKTKRADLSKISGELANAYSGCLQVNPDHLKKFFDFTDTLFILYKHSKDSKRRETINKNFMSLIEKLSIKA